MAFLENSIERATALAATCGWLALGGGADAAVGVIIGGAGLASVLSDAIRKHGPESNAALRSIRKRISSDLEAYAHLERWENRADIQAADGSMERALAGCFLDRKALAASTRSPEGFPATATEIIFAQLSEREPGVFGQGGSLTAQNYARLVIRTALEAAIENENYFKKLHPHLVMETLRSLGALEVQLNEVHRIVSKTHEIAESFSSKRIAEVSDIVGRISKFIRFTFPGRLDSPTFDKSSPALTKELFDDLYRLRDLEFRMSDEQITQTEDFILQTVNGINEIIDAIKNEAKKPAPNIMIVNRTHETVAIRVDECGRLLSRTFV